MAPKAKSKKSVISLSTKKAPAKAAKASKAPTSTTGTGIAGPPHAEGDQSPAMLPDVGPPLLPFPPANPLSIEMSTGRTQLQSGDLAKGKTALEVTASGSIVAQKGSGFRSPKNGSAVDMKADAIFAGWSGRRWGFLI